MIMGRSVCVWMRVFVCVRVSSRRYQVSGAQPPEQFVYVLKEVLKQQAKEPTGAEGQACAVGGECA